MRPPKKPDDSPDQPLKTSPTQSPENKKAIRKVRKQSEAQTSGSTKRKLTQNPFGASAPEASRSSSSIDGGAQAVDDGLGGAHGGLENTKHQGKLYGQTVWANCMGKLYGQTVGTKRHAARSRTTLRHAARSRSIHKRIRKRRQTVTILCYPTKTPNPSCCAQSQYPEIN